jgi:16S rRNA processing protein RimM
MDWDSMILVGRIVRPQGNRGEVVIAPETDFAAERFRPGASVTTRRGGGPESLAVVESREHDGRWIVGFAGVTSIDEAEQLRGAELRIDPRDIRELEPGAFYAHDLIGCRVQTTTGTAVGEVSAVQLDTGTPLLVVNAEGREVLVPLAEEICRRIDVAGKVVVIEAIDGLLDVNAP